MRTDNTLHRTKDYGMFELHPCNRPLHNTDALMASMEEHGFMPSSPLQVIRNGNGKLKVIRGHHRLHCAKALGLPVYYVIDHSNTDLFALEGSSLARWSAQDHASARAAAGQPDYVKLIEFQAQHGLPLATAAALLSGHTASSAHQKNAGVASGTFTVAKDLAHANAVVRVTDYCHERGVPFARASAFVGAVSRAMRVPEFDADVFMHRVSLYGANMHRRSRVDQYLDEIESLYNFAARGKRVPLVHRANEVVRARAAHAVKHAAKLEREMAQK